MKGIILVACLMTLMQAPFLLCNKPLNISSKQANITVFVHGTISRGILNYVSWPTTFGSLLTDNLNDTLYKEGLIEIRKDSYFNTGQAIQNSGLHKITKLEKDQIAQTGAHLLATIFDRVDTWHGKDADNNRYYTFGWSGLLSSKARYEESIQFYSQLSQEIGLYQANGHKVHLTIIGYSHGGNLALNLARIKNENPSNTVFTVDQLILLGMPVQMETSYLINDPLFKSIYHFYSESDSVQSRDIFTGQEFCSKQVFKKQLCSDKLTQIKIKMKRNKKTNRPYENSEARQLRFATNNREKRTASPGHIELWFFGSTSKNYRNSLPIYPLPFAGIIPTLMPTLQSLDHQTDLRKVTLDIRPHQEEIRVKQFGELKTVPFIRREQMAELSSLVKQHSPPPLCAKEFTVHLENAVQQACDTLKTRSVEKRAIKREKRKKS